ncbi:MAG: Rieske (2Fe-2S) protein [Chloroflexota bacterium]|nr:Rieske (2Fe-2S) protein [Chloroflexota bacterium]
MLARFFTRLIDAQGIWARPLGGFVQRILKAIFGPLHLVKDFLNGKWLGHSLHAALSDLPIGIYTLVLVFDVLGQREAAGIALFLGILAHAAAAVAGFADYTDTDGRPRMVATVHSTLMSVAIVIYIASLVMRSNSGDQTVPIVLSFVGYGLVTAGAYVGGEVAYTLGNMVNRHAWRFMGAGKWQALDVTEIAEGVPVKAKAGALTLVLVRYGETIHALHDTCAHAGGPLSEGTIVDGCIECPWHGSRFELVTGYRKRSPTTYDQPRFEVRVSESGGWEARRVTSGSAGTGEH